MEGMPDLVVLLRRDGVVLECGGGHAVGALRPPLECTGRHLQDVFAAPAAEFLRLLVRRALSAEGTTAEASFEEDGQSYEVRARAQGPERVLCVTRLAAVAARAAAPDSLDERPRPQLDRRGFLRRCQESMSNAALREQPLAIAVIHVDGVTDIAQIIAT